MITCAGVVKRLGDRQVLNGVDLHIAAGEVVALVGASGTGKSVLLKQIVGLMQPDAGSVVVDGVDVPGASRAALRRLRARIGYAFQDGALLDSLSVRDNLRLALPDAELRSDAAGVEQRLRSMLDLLDLPSTTLDRVPAELSGGMRKRVGVARAVVHNPRVVLYDEPTTGLDPRNVERVHDMISRSARERGTTAVVITHEIPRIEEFATRVVMLAAGRIAFDGPPDRFLAGDCDLATLICATGSPAAGYLTTTSHILRSSW